MDAINIFINKEKFSNLLLIHFAWGPMDIKKRNNIAIGIITVLQKGGPTDTL